MEYNNNNNNLDNKYQNIIYIVRHGLREDWLNQKWKENSIYPEDPPLSKEGLQQVKEISNIFKNCNIQHIFCSPLTRTIQTISEISKMLNIKIKLEYGIGEWFNENDQKIKIPSLQDFYEKFPDIIDKEYTSKFLLSINESKKQLTQRVKTFINYLIENYLKKDNNSILIVSHAAVIILLIRELIQDPFFDVKCGVCSISKLIFNKKTEKFSIVTNGDCSHLSKGEQMNWNFPNEK